MFLVRETWMQLVYKFLVPSFSYEFLVRETWTVCHQLYGRGCALCRKWWTASALDVVTPKEKVKKGVVFWTGTIEPRFDIARLPSRHQWCADPKILRPHQSADSDHRSATVSAGRCCLGSTVSPQPRGLAFWPINGCCCGAWSVTGLR